MGTTPPTKSKSPLQQQLEQQQQQQQQQLQQQLQQQKQQQLQKQGADDDFQDENAGKKIFRILKHITGFFPQQVQNLLVSVYMECHLVILHAFKRSTGTINLVEQVHCF